MGPGPGSSRQARTASPQWKAGRRQCLLKGCERMFEASSCAARYCSQGCRDEASWWSRWRSQASWRSSERGKERRREQARRRRERGKRDSQEAPPAVRVGHSYTIPCGFSPCDRPGCYELFRKTSRSPLQRFCSLGCREALRRVRAREHRYRRQKGLKLVGAPLGDDDRVSHIRRC